MPPCTQLAISKFSTIHIDHILSNTENSYGDVTPEAALDKLAQLFRLAASSVPAYAALLHETKIDKLQAVSNPLNTIPYTTKDSYYHRYPLQERCLKGCLSAADFVHCSSGSSGRPTYWARNAFDELEVCARFEQVFRDNFAAHAVSTLAVIAFPLGIWVGGLFTTICSWLLAAKGYRITVATPGNKLPDVLQAVRNLGSSFQQVVLLGYPPFLKEVVDAGLAEGLDWRQHRVKMVLAGEVFSEEWRDLMVGRCSMADPLRDIVSLYGTADAGVLGNETALSVAIRRWLAQRPQVATKLFGKERLPTLVQYDPCSRLLEQHPGDGTLVVSAVGTPNTAAPLLRYCIGDAGGVVGYRQMLEFLEREGFTQPQEAHSRRLPFAWVFGRSFWAVSLYGANVYVENVMSALEQPGLSALVTGRFVLFVAEDADLDQQLGVRVELASGVEASEAVREELQRAVLEALLRLNSEYCNYVPPAKQAPALWLHPRGDPAYFPTGVKHKYTQ